MLRKVTLAIAAAASLSAMALAPTSASAGGGFFWPHHHHHHHWGPGFGVGLIGSSSDDACSTDPYISEVPIWMKRSSITVQTPNTRCVFSIIKLTDSGLLDYIVRIERQWRVNPP